MSTSSNNMSFLEHLEELRWHIIRSIAAIVFCGFICFIMKDFIFDTIIFGPKKIEKANLLGVKIITETKFLSLLND